jgi:hypothetical protein
MRRCKRLGSGSATSVTLGLDQPPPLGLDREHVMEPGDGAQLSEAIEAACSAVLQPGPTARLLWPRTCARRGHGKAIVATARKLAGLFWCMLARGKDYAHPSVRLIRTPALGMQIPARPPYSNRRFSVRVRSLQ